MPADVSMRARLAEALRRAPSALMDTPEERARHAASERNHHVGEHYYWGCAVCRGEVDTLAGAALAVIQHELESLEQQAGNARAVARDANQRAEAAQAERDRALASVPLVCADDRHQAKVRGLEAELAEARAEVERLNTDLAGWELYNDSPPERQVVSTPDISDYVEP